MIITLGFFLYLLICDLFAALICSTGMIFWAGTFNIAPDRCLSRGGMLFALIGFFPLAHHFGFMNRTQLGFAAPYWKSALLLGMMIGMASLLPLPILLMTLGVREFTPGISPMLLPTVIAHGIFSGLLIALIEETCFRGVLFSAVNKRHGQLAAWIWPSLLYASLHFFNPTPLDATPATFNTLLQSLLGAFLGLWNLQHIASFITLFLVGILLTQLRVRYGHIFWGMGIHAGWVLIIKVTQVYTDVNYQSPWLSLVGNYDGVIGWLGAIWVSLLMIGFAQMRKQCAL